MRLLAIADLHVAPRANREAVWRLPDHGADWLIVAGDIAERESLFEDTLAFLAGRFAKVIWVPGNHELWSVRREDEERTVGVARYRSLVAIARRLGVLTPEDPYPAWPVADPATGRPIVVAPLFTLYDYSFRPADVPLDGVVAWAQAMRNVCADEYLLKPDPYATRQDWCHARCDEAERRLGALPAGTRTVLVNHWPLRPDLVRIPRAPRFTPWCGTVRTADWHRRYDAVAVVSGHLHTRRTDLVHGTRFEEVSLGFPGQWDEARGVAAYLREILPLARGGGT